jgi:hypothetical protein
VLLFADEIFTEVDVFVGKIVLGEWERALVRPRLAQIFAIQRAIHRVLAFGAAAGGTDFALDARTVPFGAPLLTQLARNIHAWVTVSSYHRAASYHQNVPRTDVYVKIELDLDQKESPERVASEICRVIRRVYGVRKAEVSSMVERDDS